MTLKGMFFPWEKGVNLERLSDCKVGFPERQNEDRESKEGTVKQKAENREPS